MADSLESLRAELEALDAKKRERDEANAKRDEERRLRDEIKARKLELARTEAIDKAEAEIGQLGVDFAAVDTVEGVVLVKRPHAATYKKWRDTGKYKSAEVAALVKPCVIHPSLDEFNDLLEKFNGLLDEVADQVFLLAHGRAKEVAGK